MSWSFVLTYVIATLVHRTVGLRVRPDAEAVGLDTSLHAESAYDLGAVHAGGRVGI